MSLIAGPGLIDEIGTQRLEIVIRQIGERGHPPGTQRATDDDFFQNLVLRLGELAQIRNSRTRALGKTSVTGRTGVRFVKPF